ncbi:MAG: TetR/AcrR family transcriptional regulator [Pseudomonadota bacterium]
MTAQAARLQNAPAAPDVPDATEAPRAPLRSGDWTRAGVAQLIRGGVEKVQITRLARDLGATRGSFYWHFADRHALLVAMLDHWRVRNSGGVLDALAAARTLDQGVLDLFALWVDHQRFDPALDAAVRDWARRDSAVAQTLSAEDTARVEAIAAFFARMGYDAPETLIRARVIYFTQLSFYALGIDDAMAERESYLGAYYTAFTGRTLDPGAHDAFLDRFRAMMGARHDAEDTVTGAIL